MPRRQEGVADSRPTAIPPPKPACDERFCSAWLLGAPLVRATVTTRQTTGFVESLLGLIGLDWAVPDFSTLSRCRKTLKVNIPYRGSAGPLHLLVDSTGIKVEGEGEWSARNTAVRAGSPLAHLAQDPHRDRRENTGNPSCGVHHQRHRRCAPAARTARPDLARSGDRQR